MRLVKEVPYLSFPAFRLQETLRLYTLGNRTWTSIEHRLRKRQKETQAIEEETQRKKQLLQEQVWKFQERLQPTALNDSARSFNIKRKKPEGRRVKRSATVHVL